MEGGRFGLGMRVNNQEQWESLIDLMEMELGILGNYNEALKKIRSALYTKNWPELEIALRSLGILAGDMENSETRRHAAVENLGGKLIEMRVAKLPDKLRKRFNYLKFELKAELLRASSLARVIASYTESRGRLTRELMENFIPSSRGRIYNERGQRALGNENPLVVSHNL